MFISGVVARLLFGSTGLFGKVRPDELDELVDDDVSKFTPAGEQVWVEYQQDWMQAGVLGLGSRLLAAYASLAIIEATPDAMTAAFVIGFGISASLVFLALGFEFPVTHHMTIAALYAAVTTGNLWIGVLAGIASALLGRPGRGCS